MNESVHRTSIPWSPALPSLRERLDDAVGLAAVTVRSGFVWLIPLLMVTALATFLALMLEMFGLTPGVVDLLRGATAAFDMILPYAIATVMSATLATRWRLPRPLVATLAIGQVSVAMSLYTGGTAGDQAIGVFSGVLIPFLLVPLLGTLKNCRWMHLTECDAAGDNIQTTLNLVFPALLSSLLLLLLMLVIGATFPTSWLTGLFRYIAEIPALGAVVYATLNSALWSVGLHGYHLLLPLLNLLESADTAHSVSTFLGAFVFIGGSGATLSLAIAVLLCSRSPSHRMLAISSLPIAMFNVNELLLFGLPIVFNPRLIRPFILVPFVNALIGQGAISLGWLVPTAAELPFTSPIVLNAWMASGGSLNGVLLQLLCVGIGVAIYRPYVRAYENSRKDKEVIFRWLDTSFRQRSEEAQMLLDDPIGLHIRRVREENRLLAQLRDLSDCEFYLQYQPQVCIADGVVMGWETLIRARNPDGSRIMPGAFLPAFERAGMSREVDIWVMEHAVEQLQKWRAEGHNTTISVNVGAESLADAETVARLRTLIASAEGNIHVEVTERTLASDNDLVGETLASFREAGASILIDDFGTDYSSLSYLHRFPIDGIKIDRSFVLALDQERGMQVFGAIVTMATQLGLDIIIEGVETEAQMHLMPCDRRVSIQGWYYAKAIDPVEVPRFAPRAFVTPSS